MKVAAGNYRLGGWKIGMLEKWPANHLQVFEHLAGQHKRLGFWIKKLLLHYTPPFFIKPYIF